MTAYGYFSATNKFYNKHFILTDLEFVARKLNIAETSVSLSENQTKTYREHKAKILDIIGATKFDRIVRKLIEKKFLLWFVLN